MEELFRELGRGQNLRDAFTDATDRTEVFTRLGSTFVNTINPYFDAAAQHPLLEDNNDGIGSNELSEDVAIDAANVMTVEQGLHEDDNATSQDNYLLATIMSRSLESLLLFQGGDTQAAVSLLKTAVEDENARPSYYGPPHVPKPSGELLGEMLLLLNRPNEAVVEFEASLKQHTGRTRSLLGLARSAKAAGDDALSAKAMRQVETNWKGDLDTLMQSAYPWLKVAAD